MTIGRFVDFDEPPERLHPHVSGQPCRHASERSLAGGSSTSGQLTVIGCPLYDNATASTETLTLVDGDGASSNSLSVSTTRPQGAP